VENEPKGEKKGGRGEAAMEGKEFENAGTE
jgi:hypothetical protein